MSIHFVVQIFIELNNSTYEIRSVPTISAEEAISSDSSDSNLVNSSNSHLESTEYADVTTADITDTESRLSDFGDACRQWSFLQSFVVYFYW